MQSLLARRSRMFAGPAKGRRRLLPGVDLVLWGIPLAMILVAGILIASTQREADYADWYQHWITAGVGLVIALLIGAIPLERYKPLQWPIYGATVASLIAVRIIGVSALGAQSWINIAGFHVQPSEFAKVAADIIVGQLILGAGCYSVLIIGYVIVS
jgi:rod shape determining protein RodA